jgi:hypothetical protein
MLKRYSVNRAAMLCLVGLCLSVGEGRCQGFIGFNSDGSWESFAMNPDGSQGASLGPPQFPSWAVHGANLLPIAGAHWMWRPGVGQSSLSDLQGAYFSKQFNLQGAPLGGEALVAVDDFAEVIVNGFVAGSTGSVTDHSLAYGAQAALKTIDLTPYLVSGINTITVKVQNGPYWFSGFGCNPCTYAPSGNPAGVAFGGSLRFDTTTFAKHATWGTLKARYQ